MSQTLSDKVLIAIVFSLIPFLYTFLELISKKKYSYNKEIPVSLNKNNIEDMIINVLSTWDENKTDNDEFYSESLNKNRTSHIEKNITNQKRELFEDIKIDGLRKFRESNNGFSLIVSITLDYTIYNDKSYEGYNYKLLLPSSAQYIDSLVPPVKKKVFSNKKVVQKWWFIYENGKLKADKFK